MSQVFWRAKNGGWCRGWIGLGLAALALISPTLTRAADESTNGAKAFVVADDKSGHILLQGHMMDKLPIASLTKIASAMVVLDWVKVHNHGGLDTMIPIPGSVLATYHDNPIGFQEGDEVSMRDLLYAMMMQSDAIATDTLAGYVGRELSPVAGEEKVKTSTSVRFVAQMNLLARKLKMDRTRFFNPVGTDAVEKPYSTAEDVARLSRYAIVRPEFRFLVSQKERRITLKRAGMDNNYLLRTTNELLGVKNVDGGKTGQTARAGGCLMVTSERPAIVWQEGEKTYKTTRRLIVVVLDSPDRFGEASRLIDQAIPVYDQWLAAGHPMQEETTL